MRELLEIIAAAGFSVRIDESAKGSIIVFGNEDEEDSAEWHRRNALANDEHFKEALRRTGLRKVNQMAWLRLNMPGGAELPKMYAEAVAAFGAEKGELSACVDLLDLTNEAAHILARIRRMAVESEIGGGDIGRALAFICRAEDAVNEARAILER